MKFRSQDDGGDHAEGGTLLPKHVDQADRDTPRIALARWLVRSRAMRPDHAEASIYGEPAWDLLLDLYIRQKQGLRTSISSASIASGASHGASARLIETMCNIGWIERGTDVRDKRRDWLTLRLGPLRRFDRYFDALLDGPTDDGSMRLRRLDELNSLEAVVVAKTENPK